VPPMKCRLVVITEIIAPYRIPVFNVLAARADIDLHVIFLSETDPSIRDWNIRKDEIQFPYEVLWSWRRRVGKYNVLLNRGLASALAQVRPEVILCGGYSYLASWQAALWARRRKVPFLLWIESNRADTRHRHLPVETLKKKFISWCDAFVVPGTASRTYLQDLGVANDVIFAAPNAIDSRRFQDSARNARDRSAEVRASLGLPARYLLYVGRLVPMKGVFDLLEAYAKLDARIRSSVALVFVGDGGSRDELKHRAAVVAYGDIQFHGFAQKDQLPLYYALADALVFPTHSDAWGFVVNEAMTCGLPVIATNVAGCVADLLKNGENGFVVPPRDADALASAMETIATRQDLRITMGATSVHLITPYTPEACAAGLAEATTACK